MSANSSDDSFDSLVAAINGDSETAENSFQADTEIPDFSTSQAEDTADSLNGKEEEQGHATNVRRGTPWVDYIPPPPPPPPDDPFDALELAYLDMNWMMETKESNLLDCVEQKLPEAFYRLCVQEGSNVFRTLARMRRRKIRGKLPLKHFRDFPDEQTVRDNYADSPFLK